MRLNAHSLVHLYATSTQVEAGGAPWHTFDSARAASTATIMLADWNLLLQDIKWYTGHNFLCLRFGGSPVTPSHIGGRPWLWGVQHSNRLTTRLTCTCTSMGHVPIREYAAWFHRESSRCMCSHPHSESVIHIIHLCPLHMRSPSPGKHYQLVEFVKFLKKNPRAFEWPGADLSQSDGGGGYSEGRGRGYGHAHEPPSLSQVTCWVCWWCAASRSLPPTLAMCRGDPQNAPVSWCACYHPPVPEAI